MSAGTAPGGEPMTTVAGLEANTLVDGFFHVATWLLVMTGSLLMVRAWQRRELAPPWRGHFGLLLAGWGAFNLVEGLIDHQLLAVGLAMARGGPKRNWDPQPPQVEPSASRRAAWAREY